MVQFKINIIKHIFFFHSNKKPEIEIKNTIGVTEEEEEGLEGKRGGAASACRPPPSVGTKGEEPGVTGSLTWEFLNKVFVFYSNPLICLATFYPGGHKAPPPCPPSIQRTGSFTVWQETARRWRVFKEPTHRDKDDSKVLTHEDSVGATGGKVVDVKSP